MNDFIITSLAIATVSITITKSSMFKNLRSKFSSTFFKKLFNCPYCLNHWIALPCIFRFSAIEVLALIASASIISLLILIFLEKLDATIHDT